MVMVLLVANYQCHKPMSDRCKTFPIQINLYIDVCCFSLRLFMSNVNSRKVNSKFQNPKSKIRNPNYKQLHRKFTLNSEQMATISPNFRPKCIRISAILSRILLKIQEFLLEFQLFYSKSILLTKNALEFEIFV